MTLWAALALASARAEGEAAERAGDWAAALDAWRRCVAEGPDLDRRYCAAREAVLAPQAADGFAGWSALEATRRAYRELGSDAALARMEAALAAHPDSPAAEAIRAWIAHERSARGEHEAARALAPEGAPMRPVVEANAAAARAAGRQRAIGLTGAGLALTHLAVALRGPGPTRWPRAAAVLALLGLAPALIAWRTDAGDVGWLLVTGAWIALCTALAPRAPAWLGALGALGGAALLAWRAGWLDRVGA